MFLLITAVMIYWQVDQFQALSTSPYRVCVAANQPMRGRILDRNGVVLAYSVRDPLSPCGWRRIYNTAQHPSISSFLGYFSYVYGSTGIEAYYNDTLMSQTPPQSLQDSLQQKIGSIEHTQVYGSDIYLSIDIRIQDYIDKVWSNQDIGGVCGPGSNAGSIIVEDPQTGQILAMLSRPYYDANRLGDFSPATDNPDITKAAEYWKSITNANSGSPLVNRAIQGQYPPGSTFKTFTLIAALDSSKFSIDSGFNQQDAEHFVINGFHIDSNHLSDYQKGPEPPTFPVDLAHAYAYSDNVVFARVGAALGPSIMQDYAHRLYLSTPSDPRTIPLDTYPPVSSSLYSSGTLDPVSLAVTAYGQGQLLISPLSMSIISSSVADNGLLATPHFLLKTVPHGQDPSTTAIADFGPPTLVFSGIAAQGVRKAMRDVVTFGSIGASGGNIAAIKNQTQIIGGKTGTAQLSAGNPHTWLIAIANDDAQGQNPAQLSVVIMKERDGEGACQAPIAGQIMNFAMPLIGKV